MVPIDLIDVSQCLIIIKLVTSIKLDILKIINERNVAKKQPCRRFRERRVHERQKNICKIDSPDRRKGERRKKERRCIVLATA